MKLTKEQLNDKIEEILSEGIWNGEEVDITTKNIIDLIWPVIEYYKNGK